MCREEGGEARCAAEMRGQEVAADHPPHQRSQAGCTRGFHVAPPPILGMKWAQGVPSRGTSTPWKVLPAAAG